MNSKELIAAAENCCTDSTMEWVDRDMPGYPIREDMMMDAYRLSQHILATVRADDDEPLTNVFFGTWTDCGGPDLEIGADDIVRIWVHGKCCPLMAVKTRGEFRQLCRLLGVALKEGE